VPIYRRQAGPVLSPAVGHWGTGPLNVLEDLGDRGVVCHLEEDVGARACRNIVEELFLTDCEATCNTIWVGRQIRYQFLKVAKIASGRTAVTPSPPLLATSLSLALKTSRQSIPRSYAISITVRKYLFVKRFKLQTGVRHGWVLSRLIFFPLCYSCSWFNQNIWSGAHFMRI
jgi:hypothetical protein